MTTPKPKLLTLRAKCSTTVKTDALKWQLYRSSLDMGYLKGKDVKVEVRNFRKSDERYFKRVARVRKKARKQLTKIR